MKKNLEDHTKQRMQEQALYLAVVFQPLMTG